MILTIRKEQMDALARHRRETFERRVADHLRRLLEKAGRPLADEELAAQVKQGVASGLRFFDAEKDVVRYCEVVVLKLGRWEEADHPEAALQMLRSKAVPAAKRLGNFEQWIGQKGVRRGRSSV